MEYLLAWIIYAIVSLNDILEGDKNDVEHLRNIEEVLKRFSDPVLSVKICGFMLLEVIYCEHRVTAEDIRLT